MATIAIVGADGSGKSSITHRLAEATMVPVQVVYMGVNLEASRVMLPTTRLMLAIKRRRGRRADMVARNRSERDDRGPGMVRRVAESLRLANWIAEEWYRQLIVALHLRRGRLVVFDRHFFADYYAHHVAADGRSLPWMARVHGRMLDRLYPKPDVLIVLDAPPELLHWRKPEGTIEDLAARRAEYLEVARHVPRSVIVDASQPFDRVLSQVVKVVEQEWARGDRR